MTLFEPIAIVAEACVLPGAASPAALWSVVSQQKIVTRTVDPEELGLGPSSAPLRRFVSGRVDQAPVDHEGLLAFGGLSASALDPVHRWSLQAAWEAWSAASGRDKTDPGRRGLFLANLCYPSRSKVDYAEDVWRNGFSDRPLTDTLNSGMPARMIARMIGAGGPALALDAACASSLYALEIACRKLAARQIDIALVGAVNAADNLILHIGFDALKALSPTGRSRPFMQGADGLVPSEGAAAVVLKRLSDVTGADRVRGVIRGIGLSNDGRRKGFLAPDKEGQREAMLRAYAMANLAPDNIDFLECHATGTPVGDSVEVQSAASVFGAERALPIGSLKANAGHLITVAGLASLLKLTSAMENETLPPTPMDGALIKSIAETGLAPLSRSAQWASQGPAPKRAAISNFGFGGNNSHLILEAFEPKRGYINGHSADAPAQREEIVVVGAGLMAGGDRGERAVLRRLMNAPVTPVRHTELAGADPVKARIPPADLLRAEAHQLAMLDVSQMALEGVAKPEAERCGVFAGLRCTDESARWPIRERVSAERIASGCNDIEAELSAIAPPLVAADVLGAMANMAANRITSSDDFRGQGYAISAEESSALAALDVAAAALYAGTLDLAVVTSAEFAAGADQAAALVLKRASDAARDGDRVLGSLSGIEWLNGAASPGIGPFREVLGEAPAVSGLFDLALALSLAARSHEMRAPGAAVTLVNGESPLVVSAGGSDTAQSIRVTARPAAPAPTPDMLRPTPFLFYASAPSRPALAAKLRQGISGGSGPFRIAILAKEAPALAEKREQAAAALLEKSAPGGDGIWFGAKAPEGELAFAFTGSAAAYPRMGRGLLMAFPEVARTLGALPKAEAMTSLLAKASLSEFEQLCAVSLVTQAQAILLRDVLELSPQAAIGLSLGESNALFAFGFWKDMGGLLDDIEAAAMYERHLGGAFETAGKAWGPNVPADWTNWRVRAPLAKLREELKSAPNVEITIIYTDDDSMIGGPADACRALCQRLGPGAGTLMHQHLVVHANAMMPFEDKWRELHTRPVSRVTGVRLYANAVNAAYAPTKARVADMLTRQAVTTVDFPATIRQAWEDGVRTFVEVGPRDTLTQSIGQILSGKPHLAVATDRVETSEIAQIAELTATLFAAGHPVRIDRIAARLDEVRANPWQQASAYKVSREAKRPPPQLPQRVRTSGGLPAAPPLPPPHYAPVQTSTLPSGPVPFPAGPEGPTPDARPSAPPPTGVLSGRTALTPRRPSGKSWQRPAVEASTRGLMSTFFGDRFAGQDEYIRQVRLPAPPLLLVDRITGIDAAACEEGAGVIWTETDLSEGEWYTHKGRVRPGPLIECGQADLTLIGWMGADLKNQSERVYRLLGCEITFHEGGLPLAGDTLRFQIEITQHATFAGTRMFFFQYDCLSNARPAFSVRQGQAGFFTDAELASGKGVAWDASTSPPPTADIAGIDVSRASAKRSFSEADVTAFRQGDAFRCFGAGFELCAAHSFPPHLPAGKLAFFDAVTVFDPAAGPWKRGYLCARARVPVDAWFYEGHFHNDPCMPGTLMAEAAVQALEFYAAAIGLTQERDGYVFEPVPGETAKFVCRGQVIPDKDHDVTYEVFIDEVIPGETPRIFASLLARSDGRKVFYCPRFGIQLRRNWAAPRQAALPLRVGPQKESRGDEAALLDCASGPPSAAFGAMYDRFDREGRVPRLPQPPYHVMTRVTEVSTRPGVQQVGASIKAEYDIPPDAWYFADNRSGAMPFAVLNEIVLQPCGWLASHCGFALEGGERFRNLEGDGKILREIVPQDGTICVETTLTSFSKVGPMTIVAFDVSARLKTGEPVMDLTTRFGFFPAAALVRQAGLPISETDRGYLALPKSSHDLSPRDPRLATGRLAMLDGADYFDPSGGSAGLGLIRGRQVVDPYAWYFKAHFFNDPVQPGSLGLDALEQLLMRAVLLKAGAAKLEGAVAQTPAVGERVKWSYRGQVTPEKREVTTVIELLSLQEDLGRLVATARGSVWCDGLRIYEANPISLAFTRPA
ncbi:beta-ketoacyl synthase N-terminal-like domain-containing protein [Hyphomonas sp.]|uniref:beta-ketoacyl synthase N-terminal-like domain-containing protein n=1 Tax=Hyphomonas sp. TaxID=87 RepID=UPI00391D3C34